MRKLRVLIPEVLGRKTTNEVYEEVLIRPPAR